MRGINKQKFLTELGRLLTFMYEEDRERALAMYGSLFEETDDETGLLQMLVSPTRQAVNLARAYDARERKLQVQAQSRGDAAGADEPAFIQVIEKLRAQAAELGAPAKKVSADQVSLFEDAVRESSIFDEVGAAPTEEDEPFSAPAAAPVSPAEDEPAAAEEPAAGDEPAAPGEEPASDRPDAFPDNDNIPDKEPTQPVSDDDPGFFFDAAPEAESASVQEERQGSVSGAEPVPSPVQESAAPAAEALPRVPESFPVPEPERSRSKIRAGARPLFTKSKPRVGLLILFLLFAVPITLLCILILLAPAALALGVGAVAGWLGFSGLLATFGSFSVFADILLVFGCTLIVLGLAILFLWIFIWLLFGAIPGLIRGVCALARRWCYKEVPV